MILERFYKWNGSINGAVPNHINLPRVTRHASRAHGRTGATRCCPAGSGICAGVAPVLRRCCAVVAPGVAPGSRSEKNELDYIKVYPEH
jgi:hypothetical protein